MRSTDFQYLQSVCPSNRRGSHQTEHEAMQHMADPDRHEGRELVDVENVVSNGETTRTVFFFKRPQ